MSKIKVGIIGASGFTGQELTALLNANESVEILFIQSRSQAGKINPNTKTQFEDLSYDEMLAKKPDCVFFCTPHGIAMQNANKFLDAGIKVIDLSADFRFKDSKIFEDVYKIPFIKANKEPVYGLSEIFTDQIKSSELLANPGCYVTSALLASIPIKDKFESAIFDSKSGYSGAGVKMYNELKNNTKDNFYAYNITKHRHGYEIQQFFDQKTFFTPHLLATFRGISTTCHFMLKDEFKDFDFYSFFADYYKDHKYIKAQKEIPQIKDVQNTNNTILGGFEVNNGRLVIISVLDNLRKGAASQAVQNFHLMFNLSNEIPEISDTNIFFE